MSLRDFPQTITLWSATPDGFGGNTFAAPVLIKGRWEEKQVMYYSAKGDEVQSKAVVYLDTDVAIGDYIAQDDQTGTAVATNSSGASPVMQFRKSPDLRQHEYERKVIL